MKIGAWTLPNPVMLAPMAGVTDLPFRRLCRQLGAGMVVGEMTAADPGLRQTRKSRLRGVHRDEPEPRAIQIVGAEPAMMADSARYNVDQGAAIIDINMGCPAKKVCRKAAGSALLGDERLVGRILDAVVAAVDVPVTLKIRTGLDPHRRNAVTVARIAEDCGIQALVVHGRTRQCLYRGQAEFDTVRTVKRAVSIPVVANGDILSASQARRVLGYTGADAVMIGRGAHGAPWLPGAIGRALLGGLPESRPTLAAQHDIVRDHLIAIHDFYGPIQGVRIARKHIKWYTAGFPGSIDFRRAVLSTESPEHQITLTSDYYCRLQEARQAA